VEYEPNRFTKRVWIPSDWDLRRCSARG
jgi:hypothetical protein